MRHRPKGLAAAALTGLLTLAACGGGQSPTTRPNAADTTGGVLRFATFTVPDTFDPTKRSAGTSGLNYLFPVYDPLLRTDPTGKVVEGLATQWKLSADNVTLTLRSGLKFSDGEPLNAAAVKANLERCQAVGGGCGSTLAHVTSIDTPDDTTVVLNTDGPQPALLFGLTTGAGMMVSPKAFDSPDLGRIPVGAGAYVLDEQATVPGSKWVYTKNKNYWDPSQQTLERLEIVLINTAQQRVAALRTGQVDASMIGDAQELESYKQAGVATAVSEGGDPIGVVTVDPSGPFADKRVRQAVGYALDRAALTGTPFRKGMSTPSDQLFSPGNPGHVDNPSFTYTYDPDKARALLAEAGVKDVPVTIPAMPGPQNKTEAEAVAGMLNAVGFQAKVVSPPPQMIGREVFSGKYHLAYVPVFVPDAPMLADALAPKGGSMNPTGQPYAKALDLAKQAAAASVSDEAEARALYGEMMADLTEEGVVIPAFWSPVGVAYADHVKGLQPWAGGYMGPPVYGVTVGRQG
ncbi:ABC transporter substrate-binding protein [Sphaerimonospora thailandensis]|uniref:ABC transporter substrate-binding protein n=1 Tax=Sphaerimonospora thailandensis TaxID=795644 RepID=A0A8J3RBU8_9ACTN|nr:ABC transporter substrate-binding protein [Sphaerimonospora thailandensis]GIH69673.1 ABC transporter substrate-binding protein [Sphaerimonospora thailandensis]